VRRNLLTGLSISVLTLAAWAVPTAAQAASASAVVTCGQTLTVSTRLANDLVNCPGDGLVIGADDITLDLAGHSISGVNAPGSEGVTDDGHKGAKVENGTIHSFFLNGVGLRNAPHSSVRNLTIRKIGAGGVDGDFSAGVLVRQSPHSTVIGSTITNDVSAFQSDGVDVISSAGTTISGNTLAKNAWNGMVVLSSPRTIVVGNELDGNQNQGTEVNFGSDHTVVARNHARNNVSNGLVVGAISDALIEGNTLTGNGDTGLFMFDLLHSRVSDNRAGGNGVGISLDGGQHGSSGNRIVGNDTSSNFALGLVVADNANANTVSGNVSNANQGAPGEGGGIILFAVTGNTVRGNVANGNLDVGIGVFENSPGDSTGNVLTANRANRNRAHGIFAVTGTVDGGGNTAHHNTPRPNCLGVVCS
jgi:parallel beta-helix repeat protein